MLGLSRHTTTVKNDACCSRRPDTATPTTARAIPPSVERTCGVLGQVAGEAHGSLGHGVPLSVAWPGGRPGPWTRGRWTPWPATRPPGASGRANEVGHRSRLPAIGRLGCRVGWWRLRLVESATFPKGAVHLIYERAGKPTFGSMA